MGSYGIPPYIPEGVYTQWLLRRVIDDTVTGTGYVNFYSMLSNTGVGIIASSNVPCNMLIIDGVNGTCTDTGFDNDNNNPFVNTFSQSVRGRYMIFSESGSPQDILIYLWDGTLLYTITTLVPASNWFTGCIMSPDGHWILAGYRDPGVNKYAVYEGIP